jgi:hypothetical protein
VTVCYMYFHWSVLFSLFINPHLESSVIGMKVGGLTSSDCPMHMCHGDTKIRSVFDSHYLFHLFVWPYHAITVFMSFDGTIVDIATVIVVLQEGNLSENSHTQPTPKPR